MKRPLSDSPAKLALLSGICGLMAWAFFLIPGSRLVHSPLFGAYLLFGIVSVPVCTILPFKFITDLRHGIEDERWTEAQLEPLRAHLESPYYTALSVGLLVALFIFPFLRGSSGELAGFCGFYLYFLLYQLRVVLKRPPSSTPPIDGHDATPIHSDHWGHR